MLLKLCKIFQQIQFGHSSNLWCLQVTKKASLIRQELWLQIYSRKGGMQSERTFGFQQIREFVTVFQFAVTAQCGTRSLEFILKLFIAFKPHQKIILKLELLYSYAECPELNFEKYVIRAIPQKNAEDQNEEIEECELRVIDFA